MKTLTRLGPLTGMPAKGKLAKMECDGVALCVSNIKGDLRAMADECPHKGVSLSEGKLDGKRVVCPRHDWKFKTKDGSCRQHGIAAKTYALFQIGSEIFVQIR